MKTKDFIKDEKGDMLMTGIGLLMVVVCIAGLMGIWYLYKNVQVWGAEMSGRAVLAEAEYSRQVRVLESKAKNEAAELEGQAELTRAEYSAKANLELAEGLGGSDNYLRYMFIRMLEETDMAGQVIYIPTEGNMPIMEAGKR
jgi:regulator of protease activity HflC (stomatin/prohibitin superfamily)